MSSDSTGEIYVVTKEDGSGVAGVSEVEGGGSTTGPTESGSAPIPSESTAAARRWTVVGGSYWIAGAAVVGAMV
jgi:hypothetical protein